MAIKTLAEGFGFGTYKELVSGVSEGRRKTSISGKTSKISKNALNRVLFQELENTYHADPITFNAVNKSSQMIMAAGYRFDVDEGDKDDFMSFIDNLGQVGDDYTFDELLESFFRNEVLFGYSWTEKVMNEEMTDILDITRLDPKQMDYARDAEGNILFDLNQKPIGYLQTLGTLAIGTSTNGLGDEVPEEFKGTIDKSDNQIFVLPERIALFKLYTSSNGFDAYGLIEPAYKSILRKLNIEEARTNSIYARGTYPLVDYIGNEKTPPTNQRLESALEIMKKMKHDRYFAVPYWHNIKPIEAKESDMVDNTLKHLRENQSASFGMALAFLTGAGEATNRSTLNNLQKMVEYTLNDLVIKVVANIHKQIFTPLAKFRNYKRPPKIIWNKVGVEDWDEKSERLLKWVNAGTIQSSEVRELIAKQEGIELKPMEDTKSEQKEEKEVDIPKEIEKKVINNVRRKI